MRQDGNYIKTMEVSNPWFDCIFTGIKTVEVRKGGGTWAGLEKGDALELTEKGGSRRKRFMVVEVRKYSSLLDCFIAEGVRHLLPGLSTLDEGYDVYLGFDGKEKMEDRRMEFSVQGALAIELEPINYETKIKTDDKKYLMNDKKKEIEKITGDPKCPHKNIRYNDETMGGCGSGWDSVCEDCGKVWYD